MDRWDVLAALGIALVGTGLGLLQLWLGIATAGLLLLAAGITGGVLTERAARAERAATERRGG